MGYGEFRKRMEIEVFSDDMSYRGALFPAKIVQLNSIENTVLVEYDSLMEDEEEGSEPLRELMNVVNIRPKPPRDLRCRFELSDEVDAIQDGIWWEGVVMRDMGDRMYMVYFRPSKEELEFEGDELRVHREWASGCWVPPSTEKSCSSLHRRRKKKMSQTVCGKEGEVAGIRVDSVTPSEKEAAPPRNKKRIRSLADILSHWPSQF